MFDIEKIKAKIIPKSRYNYQIDRMIANKKGTACIEKAVNDSIENIKNNKRSFVIYGEPQSGKTEMMICLTAKLLDEKNKIIILLLNDNVELLNQNLNRFIESNLAPSPKNYTEVLDPSITIGENDWVIFCKKNSGDLKKIIDKLSKYKKKVIIDDEADYASPNSKINKGDKTTINKLIEQLIGEDGIYIGVTATPARLDLNNTFKNKTESWVDFLPHHNYKGQETFFPTDLENELGFQLKLLPETGDDPHFLREALFRFVVNVSYLNQIINDGIEENYSMLVHTSGKVSDHSQDLANIQKTLDVLYTPSHINHEKYWREIWEISNKKYPGYADSITSYAIQTINRNKIVLMNSDTDKKATDFKSATKPAAPFTIAIGGNIISRGVTFENLLSMFFTRDIKHKMQQDTYIQRARMFGSRGNYLKYFELNIPADLYANWHKCFVFHRLSINSIRAGKGAPTWIGDSKVSPVAPSSIDKTNVDVDSGEMSFRIFKLNAAIRELISNDALSAYQRLEKLMNLLGDDYAPKHLLEFIRHFSPNGDSSVAFHPTTSINGYKDADQANIARSRSFMGQRDMQKEKFPQAIHHLKIFHNNDNEARLFYKYDEKVNFIKNFKNYQP
jgi:Z1 domain/Type III restriction enzyme, res subunit